MNWVESQIPVPTCKRTHARNQGPRSRCLRYARAVTDGSTGSIDGRGCRNDNSLSTCGQFQKQGPIRPGNSDLATKENRNDSPPPRRVCFNTRSGVTHDPLGTPCITLFPAPRFRGLQGRFGFSSFPCGIKGSCKSCCMLCTRQELVRVHHEFFR